MTPKEFLDTVVEPNITDFKSDYGSIRHAFNAVMAIDALAAHIFVWCRNNLQQSGNDSLYRAALAKQNPDFSLIRDIAKAQKHVHLDNGNPQVQRADQMTVQALGYGVARFGEGRFGSPPQVVIDIDNGIRCVEAIVDGAYAFLTKEMENIGIE